MNEAAEIIIVFITTGSGEEADKIARILVGQRKAACVNIVSGIESLYWWKSKIESAKESMLIVKTLSSELPELIKIVKLNHSYQLPEIIAIPVVGGSDNYLKWLRGEIKTQPSL